MAYASEVDIKISETPKTTDPDLLPDLIDIYNALHILAQYTDQLRDYVSKRSEGDPWETFPLDNIVYTKAYTDISQGQVCGPAYIYKRNATQNNTSSFHGAVRGVPFSISARDPRSGRSNIRNNLNPNTNGLFGIAIEDTKAGDLVPIALGPGVLEVPGLKAGESVFAWAAYTEHMIPEPGTFGGYLRYLTLRNNGSIFRLSLTPARYADMQHMHRIGVGVAQDAMYLFPSPLNPTDASTGTISQPQY